MRSECKFKKATSANTDSWMEFAIDPSGGQDHCIVLLFAVLNPFDLKGPYSHEDRRSPIVVQVNLNPSIPHCSCDPKVSPSPDKATKYFGGVDPYTTTLTNMSTDCQNRT